MNDTLPSNGVRVRGHDAQDLAPPSISRQSSSEVRALHARRQPVRHDGDAQDVVRAVPERSEFAAHPGTCFFNMIAVDDAASIESSGVAHRVRAQRHAIKACGAKGLQRDGMQAGEPRRLCHIERRQRRSISVLHIQTEDEVFN